MKAIELKIANVCNWIRNNPKTEANPYEMSDVFIEISRSCKDELCKQTDMNLEYLGNKRLLDLKEKSEIEEDHPLFLLEQELFEQAKSGKEITSDDRIKELICKCASVSFYIINEKKKDSNFILRNKMEILQIHEMYEYSQKCGVILSKHCIELLKYIEENSIYIIKRLGLNSKPFY